MKKIEFKGVYKDLLTEFVHIKRQCGYKYNTEEKILSYFDLLTIERNETEPIITSELAQAWSQNRTNESSSYRYTRCCVFNQFSTYLRQQDKLCPVCRVPTPKSDYTPHIYSSNELERLFAVCDNEICTPIRVDSLRFIMPALLRLLLCTGIRIGEALGLLDKDVNLQHRILILRDTKSGKERLIPFADSLADILAQYRMHRERLNPQPVNPQFFLLARGKTSSTTSVYNCFKRYLRKADIPFKGGHHGPRLHDLRHTFAVKSLVQMVENGMDIYCSLPILSTYLGHQSIEATGQYVRLVQEMYPDISYTMDTTYLNIYPFIDTQNEMHDEDN